MTARGPTTLFAGLLVAFGARAAGAVECAALPTPVFATGSTAAKPLLAEIGKIMAAQSPPTTVVYLGARFVRRRRRDPVRDAHHGVRHQRAQLPGTAPARS